MVVLTRDPELYPALPAVEVDERAARRQLREQIARLEAEMSAAVITAFPRLDPPAPVAGFAGPRILGLGELERTRDELAERLQELRAATTVQADAQEAKRLLVEHMLLDPARYKWVRVSGADVGEAACRHWHVRPRLGLVGMLMGWWQVKISSGCPLSAARRAR